MKQIMVHSKEVEVQIAVLEQGRLVEFYVEQSAKKSIVGNIYKGKVVNVLQGLQAAFIDIGLDKNAFLYLDDILPAHLEKQPKMKPSIHQLLKAGQEIMVQITKEPMGTKGARVTTHISIAGRWLVFMPTADYVGVSKKILSEKERDRLKLIAEQLREGTEGIIVRTVAEEETMDSLKSDLHQLKTIWNEIVELERFSSNPMELYRDKDMLEKLVRDDITQDATEIMIDDALKSEQMKRHALQISTSLVSRVRYYQPSIPLFDHYGVNEQLEKALRDKVWLQNGGYLMLNRTEALTVIDVNTGKYTGFINLEETVYETNLEAAVEIGRLLRLRDIGGIIIIDFIDMTEEQHRQSIMDTLSKEMEKDRTKSIVVGWTRLGLLEVTRKKVRDNLDVSFYMPCSACNGKGRVFSSQHPFY